MNRKERRRLAAIQARIEGPQERLAGQVEKAKVALEELQDGSLEQLMDAGIQPKRLEAVRKQLTRSLAEADKAAANRVIDLAQRVDSLKKDIRNFDALLAGWGEVIWEIAHYVEDYDAEARQVIGDATREGINGYLVPEALMFSAVWAVDAFQRVTTTHTFAAALMCSDPDRGALEAIEKQWRAFMFIVPSELLTVEWQDVEKVEKRELTRILVSVDDASAKMLLCYPVHEAESMLFTPLQAPTFADLLLDEPEEMFSTKSHRPLEDIRSQQAENRVIRVVQRIVAGLLLAMQNTQNFKDRVVPAKRSVNKRTPGAPAHRLIHVGRPLNIDLRPNIQEYIRTGKTGRRHGGPPTVQVLVRGHYKRQVHGVGRLLRKVIWIEPFWRGPEEAVINVRPKLKAER